MWPAFLLKNGMYISMNFLVLLIGPLYDAHMDTATTKCSFISHSCQVVNAI